MAADYEHERFWIFDSGGARHLISDRKASISLHEYTANENPHTHKTAGGGPVAVRGYGTAKMRLHHLYGSHTEYTFNAYFNPDMDFNLLSTTRAREEMGIWWSSKDLFIRDIKTDIIVGTTYIDQGVPVVNVVPSTTEVAAVATPHYSDDEMEIVLAAVKEDVMKAHRRLGHCGIAKLRGATDTKEKIEKHLSVMSAVKQMRNARYLEKNNLSTTLTRMIRPQYVLKEHYGRYPRYWQIDGGGEFKKVATWGRKRGITFKVTPHVHQNQTANPNV
ncbi:hypothetical protein BDW66DRAFT_155700 [Aspergillus desertorum]